MELMIQDRNGSTNSVSTKAETLNEAIVEGIKLFGSNVVSMVGVVEFYGAPFMGVLYRHEDCGCPSCVPGIYWKGQSGRMRLAQRLGER